jgi:hypothetical protein
VPSRNESKTENETMATATYEQAIKSANELLASDSAIRSVEVEFVFSTGQKYRGEWDGIKFLRLRAIS